MNADEWKTLVERVLRTLGEVSPDDIQSATFTTCPHALAAGSDEPLAPNDGRPKIFTLTVTTRG